MLQDDAALFCDADGLAQRLALVFFVYRWYKGPNSSVMSYWLSEKADKSSALPWVIVICSAGSI